MNESQELHVGGCPPPRRMQEARGRRRVMAPESDILAKSQLGHLSRVSLSL